MKGERLVVVFLVALAVVWKVYEVGYTAGERAARQLNGGRR